MSTRCIAGTIRRGLWITSVVIAGYMLLALPLGGCQMAAPLTDTDTVPPESVDPQGEAVSNEAPQQDAPSSPVAESVAVVSPGAPSVETPASAVQQKTEGVTKGPNIVVENSLFDFGEVTPMAEAKGKFVFGNEGQGILEITKVQGCCGAEITLDKKQLAAGEKAVLAVTYHFSYIGPMEKYIYLLTNDVDHPNVKLTIKGEVVRKLTWEPQRLKLFLDVDNAGCPDIVVKSVDGKPFSIKDVSCTGDCIGLTFDPSVEAREFTLQPKVDIEKLQSMTRPQGVLRVQHTHTGCDDIALNFDLLQRYSHLPPRFLIFNADPAVTLAPRTLHIQDNYAENKLHASPSAPLTAPNFEIESVICSKATAVLKETSPIRAGYSLTFDILPPQPDGNRYFKDEVIIKIKGEEKEIRVPVDGYYTQKVIQQAIKEQATQQQGSN